MLNSIHVFTFTDNFSKFHMNQLTNEGAVQVTTYKSPSQKVIPLTDFAFTITDNFLKFHVY
jgi:hypothetical protein